MIPLNEEDFFEQNTNQKVPEVVQNDARRVVIVKKVTLTSMVILILYPAWRSRLLWFCHGWKTLNRAERRSIVSFCRRRRFDVGKHIDRSLGVSHTDVWIPFQSNLGQKFFPSFVDDVDRALHFGGLVWNLHLEKERRNLCGRIVGLVARRIGGLRATQIGELEFTRIGGLKGPCLVCIHDGLGWNHFWTTSTTLQWPVWSPAFQLSRCASRVARCIPPAICVRILEIGRVKQVVLGFLCSYVCVCPTISTALKVFGPQKYKCILLVYLKY